MVKLFAAVFPFYMILSLPFCSVWVSYNVWMLPFAESGLLPYWCTNYVIITALSTITFSVNLCGYVEFIKTMGFI